MSQASAATSPHSMPYHTPLVYLPAANTANPVYTNQPLPTRVFLGGSCGNGHAPRQPGHPGLAQAFPGMMPSTRPGGSQVQNHHQMGAQQLWGYQATGGGYPRHQMPNDFRSGGHPVHHSTVCSPHGGQPHTSLPWHGVAVARGPETTRPLSADHHGAQTSIGMGPHPLTFPSLGAHTHQEVAPPPQPSPHAHDLSYLSNNTATMAVQYTPLKLSFEDVLSITTTPTPSSTPTSTSTPTPTTPPPRKKSGPKELPSVQATCPFPKCRWRRRYGRLQELNRHVRQHFPKHLRCQSCPWTGNRRYALRNHIKKKHPGVTLAEHEHEQEGSVIYDAKTLAKQLLNEEIGVDWAVCEARSLFLIKAVQLGMLGAWRE